MVLVGRGTSMPARLLEGLETRGAQVQIVSDPASVMAELAAGAKAVVINEPPRVRRLGELLAAMRRYYPQTACWQFVAQGPEGEPLLERMASPVSRMMPPMGPLADKVSPSAPADPKTPEKPLIRVSEAPRAAPPPPKAAPAEEERLLSQEELLMLLAPLSEDLPRPDGKTGSSAEGQP